MLESCREGRRGVCRPTADCISFDLSALGFPQLRLPRRLPSCICNMAAMMGGVILNVGCARRSEKASPDALSFACMPALNGPVSMIEKNWLQTSTGMFWTDRIGTMSKY